MSAQEEKKPLSSLLTSTIKSTIGSSGETELTRWRRTFDRFAEEGEDGVKRLNSAQFIDAIVPPSDSGGFSRIKREQYQILFRVADSSKKGAITYEDFVVFETLLKRPDADYQLAFQVFDVDDSGTVEFSEFQSVLQENLAASGIPFNFDCDWMKLYVGKRGGTHVLGYQEFTQALKGFQGERLRQAFHYFDADSDGYITPEQFQRIIVEIAGHKLSDSILERLPTLCTMNPGKRISYSEVFAFHNVIREMDTVERIIGRAVRQSKDGRIDVSDFLNEAAASMRTSIFTPLEATIIWHFASRGGAGSNTRLTLADFEALLDAQWQPPQVQLPSSTPVQTTMLSDIGAPVYNFTLGGIAGAMGAFAVYPIDMVKTRLQNQRSTIVGEVLYKGPIDCVKKIYYNEGGIRGFYRGMVPQLVGVAPEKSIKLVVNSTMRAKLSDPETGVITLPSELIAGGTAGACQVAVTNPLEIVKIRLQMAGEIARSEGGAAVQRGAVHVIKQLGLLGLYKGAIACLCRDVPFSMIYFPTYAHLKKDVFHEGRRGKVLSLGELLISAGVAGMPAAWGTTPFDVCKTRLQTQARAGETQYKGVVDAFRTILREEGPRALFKGGIARVVRSSPQFAVTLTVFELLSKNFPYPYADVVTPAASRPVRAQPDISRIRARNALRILLDCSSNFGMVGPEAASKKVSKLPRFISGVVGKELA